MPMAAEASSSEDPRATSESGTAATVAMVDLPRLPRRWTVSPSKKLRRSMADSARATTEWPRLESLDGYTRRLSLDLEAARMAVDRSTGASLFLLPAPLSDGDDDFATTFFFFFFDFLGADSARSPRRRAIDTQKARQRDKYQCTFARSHETAAPRRDVHSPVEPPRGGSGTRSKNASRCITRVPNKAAAAPDRGIDAVAATEESATAAAASSAAVGGESGICMLAGEARREAEAGGGGRCGKWERGTIQ
mmetsp:Transcript_30998/g.70924  ORF Transcript_30998/g.70924 Transcript_30998/m.70924 type:complete len:250 (+) Transcript_30998:2268-3017(+)